MIIMLNNYKNKNTSEVIQMAEEFMGDEIFTLTDEEGNESEFELIASQEIDGVTYVALVPYEEGKEEDKEEEYVVLKMEADADGEDILVTIDDDDEFEKVAEIFEDMLFDEIDYDAE